MAAAATADRLRGGSASPYGVKLVLFLVALSVVPPRVEPTSAPMAIALSGDANSAEPVTSSPVRETSQQTTSTVAPIRTSSAGKRTNGITEESLVSEGAGSPTTASEKPAALQPSTTGSVPPVEDRDEDPAEEAASEVPDFTADVNTLAVSSTTAAGPSAAAPAEPAAKETGGPSVPGPDLAVVDTGSHPARETTAGFDPAPDPVATRPSLRATTSRFVAPRPRPRPRPRPAEIIYAAPPPLPPNFHMALDVWDAAKDRRFTVSEHQEGSRLSTSLSAPTGPPAYSAAPPTAMPSPILMPNGRAPHTPKHPPARLCLANLATGVGHVVSGVRCRISTLLPSHCFCDERGRDCGESYVRFASALAFLRSGSRGLGLSEVADDVDDEEVGDEEDMEDRVVGGSDEDEEAEERRREEEEEEATTVQEVGVGSVGLVTWRRGSSGGGGSAMSNNSVRVEATYVKTEGHPLMPATLTIEGSGKVFGFPNTYIHLVYNVVNFKVGGGGGGGGGGNGGGGGGSWNRVGSPFVPPPGVFCPPIEVSSRRRMPQLSDQFSLTMETIVHNARLLSYQEQHYDLGESLVSFEWRPRLQQQLHRLLLPLLVRPPPPPPPPSSSHSSMFQPQSPVSLPLQTGLAPPGDSYRIVHDFKTGVQYRINERTGNCSIGPIPTDSPDAAPAPASTSTFSTGSSSDVDTTTRIRLRHAQELLQHAAREDFVYWGLRDVRGVVCDVWVAANRRRDTGNIQDVVEDKRGHSDDGTVEGMSGGRSIKYGMGEYSTVEVFLSHKDWTVETEDLGQVQRVPIGIATYSAPTENSWTFSEVATTHYVAYKTGHPGWSHFDVAPCLDRINRLFLRLSLLVKYEDLVQYSMESARESLRRAIAGIAGVTPLRVSQLTLSSGIGSHGTSGDDEGTVGPVTHVWFVLLEAPGVTGPVEQPRPQLSLTDAFQMLRGITRRHEVPLRIALGAQRQKVVQIAPGSLMKTPEAFHPLTRRRSSPVMYLQTSYTAGSMAGLGFSMCVVGGCLGLLLGFLMWRRKPGVPYRLAE
ncbi:uncharacterized protein [Hetaerina americana]|uniref:uncharacterized protein n=1 Tax=Hetaerina americana TaxID=62018 RepID=UPI003A7F4E97